MSATALSIAAVLTLATDCGGARPESEFATRLAAVAEHESARHPLAIGVNAEPARGLSGQSLRFSSPAEAARAAHDLLRQGRRIDLGLMQISHVNLGRHGLSVETALNACENMRAGAAHLAGDLRAVWGLAHRRYNTGGVERGAAYAEGVERALARVRQAEGAGSASRDVPPAREAAPFPPACAPSWDPWARLACERRTHRSAPPPARQDEAPTTALARGGAAAVANNTPDLSGAQR